MTESKDSSAVRAGEELDLAKLDRYLREQLSEPATGPAAMLEVEQFPGGHSNLTYLVCYGAQEFVLRRPPVGPVAPTAHDMPREFKLLSVIHPSFPLAPAPVLLCEDPSIIGVPFYLMERRRGAIVRTPGSVSDDHAFRRLLSASVVDTLAALHAVEIQASGIVNIGKPVGFVERQVRGWAERWQRSQTGAVAEMDDVIKWLRERLPPDDGKDATIVHNDFKLDNLMLDRDHPRAWLRCWIGKCVQWVIR